MSMNYSVHSIMYFYYYLSAIGKRVSWASFVTTIQIAQMFAGVTITVKIELTRRAGVPCAITPGCHAFTCLIYSSYLYLFCRFAWYRFGPGRSTRGAAGASKRSKGSVTGANGASATGGASGPGGGVSLTRRVKGDVGGAAGLAGGNSGMLHATSAPVARLDDLEGGVVGTSLAANVPRVKQRLD